MPFAWSDGADLTKDGGKAYNFDSPEMLEATKYYQSFFTDGISDKAAPATPTTEPDFASGKVPMFISGPWMMSAVEKAGGDGVQGQVRRRSRSRPTRPSSSFVGGSNLVVFKNTKNRDAAWKLVQWLSDPKTQVEVVQACRPTCPSVKSAWQDPALTADPKLPSSASSSRPPRPRRRSRPGSRSSTAFDTEMEKVTKTGADPAAALKTVQTAGRLHRDRQLTMSTRPSAIRRARRVARRPPGPVAPPQARRTSRPPAGGGGRRGSWRCRSSCSSSSSRPGRCSSRCS